VLTDRKDALVVPKANATALASAINTLIEDPALASALANEARRTGARYDIAAFVRKMERLYELLHESARVQGPPSRGRFGGPSRAGILKTDLGFLTAPQKAQKTQAAEGTDGAE
jgi:hypothetical protein